MSIISAVLPRPKLQVGIFANVFIINDPPISHLSSTSGIPFLFFWKEVFSCCLRPLPTSVPYLDFSPFLWNLLGFGWFQETLRKEFSLFSTGTIQEIFYQTESVERISREMWMTFGPSIPDCRQLARKGTVAVISGILALSSLSDLALNLSQSQCISLWINV